ncbi:MAG: ATP-binding protein [Oscillospiraceae bacterium]|nr:ATP-binding protein [Oscillospiraceae bacterium]
MKKRLFLYMLFIVFSGLAVFFGTSVYITHTNNINIAKTAVIEIAQITADLYKLHGNECDDLEFVRTESDERVTRITIVNSTGEVIADSLPGYPTISTRPDYLERPEIIAAIEGNPQAYVRRSNTLGVDLIYYALKVPIDDEADYVFVRAAIPAEQINEYMYQSLLIFMAILLCAAFLCFVIIGNIVKRITKPFDSIEKKLRRISDGEYSLMPIAGSYGEIDRITRRIDDISQILQNSFDSLSYEKNKLDYILENIGDGIFTVDKDATVTLINNSALALFEVNAGVVGQDLSELLVDEDENDEVEELGYAIRSCIVGRKSTVVDIAHKGRTFLVKVKRLPDTELTMAVLSDVTENRKNAKQREEFFANASHELKTPLTAIRGFNELTALNNKDERLEKFINSITRETDRMLTLISDMLKISAIESLQNIGGITAVPVPLLPVVSDVKDTVSTIIAEKGVSLIISDTLRGTIVRAEQSHVYDIVKNLVENAVRYNKQGGEVKVSVKKKKNAVHLIVSDTGIGIPADEQARIFERFYRVEKSRSGTGGGTGLGLSIIKHICALYGWEIALKSDAGVGTEVTVKFKP